ncbi:MAG: ParB/RepB/Spo0J family partition protein, partial [bacterium]|nr:ParB/RepB/Spo0J family partition protein [bacterium]
MKSKPLGKGLQALFDEAPLSNYIDKGMNFLEIPVDKIHPNHLQPRENVDPERFEALKESIRQKGLIQPIAVRQVDDGFEVVAGQRRLDAVKTLEQKTIPAYILDISDDKSLLEVSLLENIRRADLNPIEVAAGYKKLSEDFGMTQKEISEVFSIDRTSVTNMIRLLKLPNEIKEEVRSGKLSMGHARALLALPSTKEQKYLAKKILKEDLSVRQTEDILKRVKI